MVGYWVTATPGLDAHLSVARGEFALDVHMRIEPGRTAALLGPNGAGKTTAVNALAGVVPLLGGRIALNDVVLDDPAAGVFVPAEGRHVGVVFQDYLLFPHMSALENVAFALRSRGTARAQAHAAARAWLDRLDVGGVAAQLPRDLSGGQAQRVALARALIADPALLLLDEPLAALDVSTRSALRRTLATHLRQFAGPRLVITHDPLEAFLLADVIYIIEGGHITQSGTAEDIRLRPKTRYVADLAGANLVRGLARDGEVEVDGQTLHIADLDVSGAVLATVHARAIALHRTQPEGSPRNTWRTSVERLEHYGDRVRVQTGGPVPLAVEVTPGAVAALDLETGGEVWVSIKATEIGVQSL